MEIISLPWHKVLNAVLAELSIHKRLSDIFSDKHLGAKLSYRELMYKFKICFGCAFQVFCHD